MHKPIFVTTCLSCLFTVTALSGCRGEASGPGSMVAATRPTTDLERFEYRARKLGSDYHLVLYASDRTTADAAAKAAEAEIDRLEAVFSDYKPDSEVSRLSRATEEGPMPTPVAISDDLYEVLWAAQALATDTEGGFDVTVGPYVQLWRRSRRLQELPSPERLADVAGAVGYQKLKLEPFDHDGSETAAPRAPASDAPPTPKAQLLAPRMRLDLGGIATGYISDRVLVVLRDRGITSAICDLSGDLAVGDPPPGQTGWRVAVRSVTAPDQTAEYLRMANCGVSTSGDTYRFVEMDGVRYSHIVDVRTGLGLTRRVGATVVATNGMTADAMATAVSIVGSGRGLALLADWECEGKITEQAGNSLNTVQSKGYNSLKTSAKED